MGGYCDIRLVYNILILHRELDTSNVAICSGETRLSIKIPFYVMIEHYFRCNNGQIIQKKTNTIEYKLLRCHHTQSNFNSLYYTYTRDAALFHIVFITINWVIFLN